MPTDVVALSRRIAKMKPLERDCWLDTYNDKSTGLPLALPPFSIAPERDEDRNRVGTWRVSVADRSNYGESNLFEGVPDVFSAYRLMVDCFEAWQLIKPVEQVYFIGTRLERGRLIKVGYSRDPEARLRALQTSHGERLSIFATVNGGKDLEAKYHRRWRLRRREGEWFMIGDCIIDEVNRLRA